MGVPQNRWIIKEHPIKMDDLGVPLFMEPPICTLGYAQHFFAAGFYTKAIHIAVVGFEMTVKS